MTGDELRKLRQRIGLTQTEMAAALDQSFATINRWEQGHRPIPEKTARLLSCLSDLAGKPDEERRSIGDEDIRDALRTAGVVGVVAGAAAAGLISTRLIALLAATGPFGWIATIAGLGVASALPFFLKVGRTKSKISEDDVHAD
jgi:transcriptional regulator with XRE-family HTH domain